MQLSQASEGRDFIELEISWGIERSSGDPCDAMSFLANNPRPEVSRDKENQRAEHCETNSDARN
jgi:hypothetical protein